MINENVLKEVLSIPSLYGQETLVREYVINFCETNEYDYYVDDIGNVYVTKGQVLEGEYYPCVVAHMDTVHSDQSKLIREDKRLDIITNLQGDKTILTAKNPDTKKATGIGGDDKCGVYLCLEMLLNKLTLKAAFFVSEEIGMLGSREADPNFFKDVGYAIQFDAPTDNWFSVTCSGTKLWNEEFVSVVAPILESNGITKYSNDPFTDVVQLRKKFDFCCSVLCSGYYNQHSNREYVVVEDVNKSYLTGSKLIDKLGLRKFKMVNEVVNSKSII